MVCRHKNFPHHGNYSYRELIGQVKDIKAKYSDVSSKSLKGCVEVKIKLKPTNESIEYTLKYVCKVGSKSVNVYVVEPKIMKSVCGKKVPHLYPDGSLCLFYPEYEEWKYTDKWAETLVPWSVLWLYYYEIWLQTGKWLGGGIHYNPTGNIKSKGVHK